MKAPIAIDPDAVLWTAPVTPDRPFLVLMHGRGSDEADLFDLVASLPSEPVIASVRAPIREGPGYSWFPSSTGGAGEAFDVAVDAAVQAVLGWIDSLPQIASIGLLGFSQGGAMALQLLRYRPRGFSYAVQLSGFVLDGTQPGDAELTELRPPVFWGRGTQDQVISASRIERTATWLPPHSTLDAHSYETGHSITQQELVDIAIFVRSQLVAR